MRERCAAAACPAGRASCIILQNGLIFPGSRSDAWPSTPTARSNPSGSSYWDAAQDLPGRRGPGHSPRKSGATSWTCSPIRPGPGLHVGHPEGYTATDIYCRYLRMNGYTVLHPMGFDSFGLPAENYAIQTGTHPAATTAANIDRFRDADQEPGLLLRLGPGGLDLRRRLLQVDPVDLPASSSSKGLAYESDAPINWCPTCKTGLANEEVKDGECDRCGHHGDAQEHPAVDAQDHRLRRPPSGRPGRPGLARVDQGDAAQLDRPSEGANVVFDVDGIGRGELEVYTTRPDTLFGATYMVLAPEHPLVEKITTPDQQGRRGGLHRGGRHERAIWSAPTWPRTRPACSPAPTPSTRSTAARSRSGSPTTS